MKKIHFILLLLACSGYLYAQDGMINKQLMELSPPSFPAMAIMGVVPQEINRPKSFHQMEATLINSFTQDGSFALPKNFALEVMPYWLGSHPYKEFNFDRLSKTECAPLENLAISLGSVNENQGDSVFHSQVGFGMRTLLFSGKMDRGQLDSMKKYREQFFMRSKNIFDLLNATEIAKDSSYATYDSFFKAILNEYSKILGDDPGKKERMLLAEEFLSKFIPPDIHNTAIQGKEITLQLANRMQESLDQKVQEKEFTELAARIQQFQTLKYGLFWEVAAATYLDFPNGDFHYSRVPKLGIWTTATYTLKNQLFSFIGSLRYIRDFKVETNTSDIDFGGSVLYQSHRFSLAAEYLQRYQTATISRTIDENGYDLRTTRTRYDYRTTLNISYRMTPEIILTYCFGKAFDFSDDKKNSLINQLSLNLGFGSVPLKL